MKTRLEFAEALAKKHEDQIADLWMKFGSNREQSSPFQEGTRSDGGRSEEVHRREKWRKLEIPIFAGEDVLGWTHRLERYFLLKEVTEEEKMQATVMAQEGKALSWYHWWEKCNPNPNWEGFKIAVVRRFQPSMVQNPFEQLLSLKQTGTVDEYVENFEKYVGAMRTIDQEFVRGIFLNGLKQELQAEVKLYELNSLSEMIQKVILIEQKNMLVNMKNGYSYASRTNGNSRSMPYSKTITLESKLSSDQKSSTMSGTGQSQSVESVKNRGGEFKHLTSAEVREKREKGLCFRCDEPYNREHRCKNRQFKMIIMEEEEEEGVEEVEEPLQSFRSLHLSLCSMSGFTTTRSWKVEGLLEGVAVVILIDCGASHNFIATKLVERLHLTIMETSPYMVEVGDGHKVRCKGKCAQLKFQMQNLEAIQDFYLFTLKGVDMVLGLDWLAGVGEIKADFGKLELTLKQGEKFIRIAGNPALTKTELPFGALMQVLKEEGEGLLIQCERTKTELDSQKTLPKNFLNLLDEFDEVCSDPKELPPFRKHDHAIHLKEGA
uniref:Uncharacterized protein LOC113785810 n=1 Tax=Cicer arietinum TaxID=3827 RepID=A0A3Q7X4Q6_CICAR|nr:uncharacterized protein LOC113785810 [Cicer arietinum]